VTPRKTFRFAWAARAGLLLAVSGPVACAFNPQPEPPGDESSAETSGSGPDDFNGAACVGDGGAGGSGGGCASAQGGAGGS